MPPLAIVFGALGVIVIVVGLMSSRFGLPAGARVGGIIVGVILLVAAGAVFAMGSPDAASPEERRVAPQRVVRLLQRRKRQQNLTQSKRTCR